MGPLPEMQVEAGFVWMPERRAEVGITDSGRHEPVVCSLPSAMRDGRGAALVEMATASGLPLLRPGQRNPLKTTTYGTGQLIRAALDHGANRILLAIGGSATVDGGVGAAMALGWRFLTQEGQEIGFGGGQLARIAKILPPDGGVSVKASRVPDAPSEGWGPQVIGISAGAAPHATVEVLCDVDNPLCGVYGAAHVYGPQKGATPEMVEQLDTGLAHLARLVRDQLGRDIACLPGAGAAGGLAAGAVAFMNARLTPGVDAVMSQVRLAEAMAGADWVITGEGSFDAQSLCGKVVSGVLRIARATGVKVAVCAGQVRLEPHVYRQAGIEVATACMEAGMELDYALAHSEELLAGAARRLANACLRQRDPSP